MTSTLVLGILVAFVATTLAAALRRAPTHANCPACGAATVPVQPPPWLLKHMPDVRLRWCHACSWQGWGRDGAEWIPGRPAAHHMGFHWGEDRDPGDRGFRFADQASVAPPAEPPHHPSGFRFSRPPAAPRRAHPSGFSWAPSPLERGVRSAWARREGRPEETPTGFTWKDAG